MFTSFGGINSGIFSPISLVLKEASLKA